MASKKVVLIVDHDSATRILLSALISYEIPDATVIVACNVTQAMQFLVVRKDMVGVVRKVAPSEVPYCGDYDEVARRFVDQELPFLRIAHSPDDNDGTDQLAGVGVLGYPFTGETFLDYVKRMMAP